MQLTRFSNYKFKNEKTAQNRVVIPPMASQTADLHGFVTEQTVKHYEKLGLSQAGLVFVEYSYIHQSGKGEPHQLGVDADDKITGLKKIAVEIHKTNALAGLQLVHVGSKTTKEITQDYASMAPSAIPVPVKGWQPEIPQEMTVAQIYQWVEWFVSAAKRAEQAGFDFVELHAAHGYGLNQWLSPITNHRTDEFGGNIENRAELLFKIVKAIKGQIPSLLLSVRLPAQDHFIAGLTKEEMIRVVKHLQSLDVDLINVSSGIGGWRRPDGHQGQGYLVSDANLIKDHISIPVIGVGGIETGECIDELISTKKVDFAAVGRAILKDPLSWGLANIHYQQKSD